MKKAKPKKPATKVLRVTFTVRVPLDVTATHVRCRIARSVHLWHCVPYPAWLQSGLVGAPRVEDVGAR